MVGRADFVLHGLGRLLIVGVRSQVAVLQGAEPGVPVGQESRLESLLDGLAGACDLVPLGFLILLEQFPALFESHLEELDQPGAFDDGQPVDGNGRFEQGEGFFEVEPRGKYWVVLFFEGHGMSSLARASSRKSAERIKKQYENQYKKGILLKPRGIYAEKIKRVS